MALSKDHLSTDKPQKQATAKALELLVHTCHVILCIVVVYVELTSDPVTFVLKVHTAYLLYLQSTLPHQIQPQAAHDPVRLRHTLYIICTPISHTPSVATPTKVRH